MERPISKAVIITGIVTPENLKQLQKWGFITEEESDKPIEKLSAQKIAARIQEALESGDTVETRDTDLDSVQQFLSNREEGKLHIPDLEDDRKTISIAVEFCRNRLGEYILSELPNTVEELLLNPSSYLKPTGKPKVYFVDMRNLYFGADKAFIVCTPR